MSDEPELGLTRPFPSMLRRCRSAHDHWYAVADPTALEHQERVSESGGLEPASAAATWGLAAVVVFAPTGAMEWYAGLAVQGILVAGALTTHQYLRLRRRRRATGHVLRVGPTQHQAWEFCRLAEWLTVSPAWSSGAVDPDRALPGLVWRVVAAHDELDRLQVDVDRARSHAGLSELVAARTREIAEGRAALDELHVRLLALLDAAHRVDGFWALQAAADRRRAEEDQLRERLSAPPVAPGGLAAAAGELESVQAAADALGELLALSDSVEGRRRSLP